MAKPVRISRVADRIRDEVSDLISRELKDPRLGFITITRVVMSRDLRHAKVLYSLIGAEADRARTDQALQSAKGFVRRELGRRVPLRFTPEIDFVFDPSVEEGIKIDQILNEIKGTDS